MGWIGQFFRKKENSANVPVVESNVALSFLKVREDMGKIGLWIRHFVEESVKNREEHLGLKREILEQKKIISEMQNNEEKILFALEKNASIVDAMGFQIEKISGKIEENNEKTAEKQHGTSHGTSAGHLRDMSREEEIIENPHPKQETKPKTAINNPESITDNIPESFDRSRFPASELEIIKTLYYYERPLSYGDIAKSLGKKEKSIRNLICELRKKGIEILDKPIGIREKGFYLSGKAKITISGR